MPFIECQCGEAHPPSMNTVDGLTIGSGYLTDAQIDDLVKQSG